MAEFRGGDINAVLRLVKQLSGDGDAQLSILTMALVTACQSCGIDKELAISVIAKAFDDRRDLVPLDSAEAACS